MSSNVFGFSDNTIRIFGVSSVKTDLGWNTTIDGVTQHIGVYSAVDEINRIILNLKSKKLFGQVNYIVIPDHLAVDLYFGKIIKKQHLDSSLVLHDFVSEGFSKFNTTMAILLEDVDTFESSVDLVIVKHQVINYAIAIDDTGQKINHQMPTLKPPASFPKK